MEKIIIERDVMSEKTLITLSDIFNSIIREAANKQPIDIDKYISDVYYIYVLAAHKNESLKSISESFFNEIGTSKYNIVPAAYKCLEALEKYATGTNHGKTHIQESLMDILGVVNNTMIRCNIGEYADAKSSYNAFTNIANTICKALEPYKDSYEYMTLDTKLSILKLRYGKVEKFNDSSTLPKLLTRMKESINSLIWLNS